MVSKNVLFLAYAVNPASAGLPLDSRPAASLMLGPCRRALRDAAPKKHIL